MIKEKIADKVIDEMFELFNGKTKEEFKEIFLKDDLKRTLFKIMQEFSQSDIFKYEFKDYYFNNDYKLLNDISIEKINIILSINELEQNISEIVDIFFKSDLNYGKDTITKFIVQRYRKRASLKINLTDLFIRQEEFYLKTEKQLKNCSSILNEIKNEGLKEEQFKRDIMNNEIRRRLIYALAHMSNRYLHYVLKKSYQFKNLGKTQEIDFKSAIHDVINNMEQYITDNFIKEPVFIVEISSFKDSKDFIYDKGNLKKRIDYCYFCDSYFKKAICESVRSILNDYKDYLTVTFQKQLLLLEDKMNSELFNTKFFLETDLNELNIKFDVKSMKSTLVQIGEILIMLYKELEYE